MASNNIGLTADRQNLPTVHPAIRIASVARPVFTDHRRERQCRLAPKFFTRGGIRVTRSICLAYQTLPKRSGSQHLRAENWRSGARGL